MTVAMHMFNIYIYMQCGFCSPGFVMTTHAAQVNSVITQTPLNEMDIEDLYPGNICRCTGYRSILCGFKTLAQNGNKEELKNTPQYIWDESQGYANGVATNPNVKVVEIPPPTPVEVAGHAVIPKKAKVSHLPQFAMAVPAAAPVIQYSHKWYNPQDENQLFQILGSLTPNSIYKLVHGNTSYGVFKPQEYENVDVFIDILNVASLTGINIQDSFMQFGASTSLNVLIDIFKQQLVKRPNSNQFKSYVPHFKRIAGNQVRNVGSIGGSFGMAKRWNFPSDVMLCLGAAGTTVTFWTWIDNNTGARSLKTLPLFVPVAGSADTFATWTGNFVIQSVTMPILADDVPFHTTRVAQRLQHSHPLVSAGFCYDTKTAGTVPTLLFGDIGNSEPLDTHLVPLQTMTGLLPLPDTAKLIAVVQQYGVWDQNAINKIMDTARVELTSLVHSSATQTNKDERIYIATNLLYKFIIKYLVPPGSPIVTPEELNSIADTYDVRQATPSQGSQHFFVDKTEAPISEPIIKSSALKQTSGETAYAQSVFPAGLVHAGFVLSERTVGKIIQFSDKTLTIQRLIAYMKSYFNQTFVASDFTIYVAQDLGAGNLLNQMDYMFSPSYPPPPAYDAFGGLYLPWQQFPQYVLANGQVFYYGQAVAIIVAPDYITQTRAAAFLASDAAGFIVWDSTFQPTPILDIRESKLVASTVVEGHVVPTQFNLKAPASVTPPYPPPPGKSWSRLDHYDDYLSTVTPPIPDRPPPPRVIDFTKYEIDPNYVIVEGEHEVGSQYHFYMETQSAVAWIDPNDHRAADAKKKAKAKIAPVSEAAFHTSAVAPKDVTMKLISSTQNLQETQSFPENVLNALNDGNTYHVDLEIKQIGGGCKHLLFF